MTQASEKGRDISIPKLGRRKKVGAKELAVFTRQFSVMIDAGLPLVQCIDILGEQQSNAFFKDVLRQVRQNVEEGATLFTALQKHPKVFDALYTSMVEAGETGGVLDLILQRLATLIEKVVKLKRSIISASIYPAAVVLVAVRIFHDAVLWRNHRALGDLIVDILQLSKFKLVTVLSRFPLGLGDQDRAFERRNLLRLSKLVEHLQLSLGSIKVLICLLHREAIGLQLVLVHVALRSQLLAVRVILLRSIQILLGHEQFAFDRLPILQISTLQVLALADNRHVEIVVRLDLGRLGVVDENLLARAQRG